MNISAKTSLSIRIDPVDLAELERIGLDLKPIPANRNQMIGLAIREFLERHRKTKRDK